MRKLGHCLLAGALAVGALAGPAIAADQPEGEELTKEQLPAPVRSTFEREAAGGSIEDLHKATKNGRTVYSGEVVSKGKGVDIEVADDGALIKKGSAHDEAKEHRGGR
jgi:hypothetical protein